MSDIDLTDDRYQMSFEETSVAFLARSIKETGLMCPPLVRPTNNKCIIISGFNRIRAQLYNNETKIIVNQTPPDTSDYRCLLHAITALAFQRPLTHAELIRCTGRLSFFLEKEQIVQKSPAIFNTELNARFVEDLITIGALPDPALALIHLGNLTLNTAKKISVCETGMINIFLKIFSQIKASSSKQLEIIQYIMEIVARDAIDPTNFFNAKEIQALLFDENTAPGIKTTLLRTYLFERRFPTIFKTHQRVQEKISALKLGGNIKFLPPENFEGQYYGISFKAKRYDEFAATVQTLHTALSNPALKDIFHP
ncbi:ParB N-terminal domain-containing protein [Desulfobacula sp.]|uniref:ParB N-terminal domain-containing protein n=1 Tax=Desulfobacula sp. TaxID=2593537 RepID=UPI00261E39D0|nr:ParB N-terminal domain-containing protein [Desulfobacula sp.]